MPPDPLRMYCMQSSAQEVDQRFQIASVAQEQGRAETFGGAGAQNIKGAHETRL